MRHKVDGRLFGRPSNQRKALLRGIVTALLENQRIEFITNCPPPKKVAMSSFQFSGA